MTAPGWAVRAAARHFAETGCPICAVELETLFSLPAPLVAHRTLTLEPELLTPAIEDTRRSEAPIFPTMEGGRRSTADDFAQSPHDGWRVA